MTDSVDLSVALRQGSGTSESRRLRRLEDKVPAIIYGAGKAPTAITIEHRHISKALESESFYSQILTLDVDGMREKVVIKALQRHPSKPKIMHADFLRVDAKEKISMIVPIHFLNADTAPGVKLQGGVVSHLANEVEIRCLPGNLPEFIEVDLGQLKLDESIHLSQVSAPKGVEFAALIREDDPALVRIHAAQVAQESGLSGGAPSAAEVPVIGKKESDAKEGK
ncbi:MAG: rplY [Gammaproteobacteria bacterium]|jgi:large subunit ribosomal protein L25|nr:rplY [Gammaproteobacteria bacterium]